MLLVSFFKQFSYFQQLPYAKKSPDFQFFVSLLVTKYSIAEYIVWIKFQNFSKISKWKKHQNFSTNPSFSLKHFDVAFQACLYL